MTNEKQMTLIYTTVNRLKKIVRINGMKLKYSTIVYGRFCIEWSQSHADKFTSLDVIDSQKNLV